MELVDVADSKSAGGNSMWVRVPPPAPLEKTGIFHIGKAQSFSFLAAFNRASHACTASLAARFALMADTAYKRKFFARQRCYW
jgi:hypothetical protein